MKTIGIVLVVLLLFPLVRGGESVFYCGYVKEIDTNNYRITIELAECSDGNPPTGKIVSLYLSENTLITSYGQNEEEFIKSVKTAAENNKDETLQLCLETLALGDKVVFSFDSKTEELITIQKVPEDIYVKIGDGIIGYCNYKSLDRGWKRKMLEIVSAVHQQIKQLWTSILRKMLQILEDMVSSALIFWVDFY